MDRLRVMVGVCSFVLIQYYFFHTLGFLPDFVRGFFIRSFSEIQKVLFFCRGDSPPPPPHRSGQTRRRVRRRVLRSPDCKTFYFDRLPCTPQKKKDCSISKA